MQQFERVQSWIVRRFVRRFVLPRQRERKQAPLECTLVINQWSTISPFSYPKKRYVSYQQHLLIAWLTESRLFLFSLKQGRIFEVCRFFSGNDRIFQPFSGPGDPALLFRPRRAFLRPETDAGRRLKIRCRKPAAGNRRQRFRKFKMELFFS